MEQLSLLLFFTVELNPCFMCKDPWHQIFPINILTLLLQGLYPGYIIFFVQSALMIAGSRGTYWIVLICCSFFSLLTCVVSFQTVIYRWQQAVPPTMALVKNALVFMNFAYTLLVLNYSSVGFMVCPLSLSAMHTNTLTCTFPICILRHRRIQRFSQAFYRFFLLCLNRY